MVGRKPKPTALKQLAGNPGKRPLNDREPKPEAARVRVPKGRLPAEGQRLWRALAPQLARLGVLKETDLPALEMLCLHYSVARAALETLISDGRVEVEDDEGRRHVISEGIAVTTPTTDGIKKHPAVTVFRENSLAFRAYLTDFGLTPSARARIKTDDGSTREKSLAELLFEGAEP